MNTRLRITGDIPGEARALFVSARGRFASLEVATAQFPLALRCYALGLPRLEFCC